MLEAVRLVRAGAAERVRESRGNLGGKANIIIDEKTKQTIKGILGSFTLIDLHWRWVKGLLESGGMIH